MATLIKILNPIFYFFVIFYSNSLMYRFRFSVCFVFVVLLYIWRKTKYLKLKQKSIFINERLVDNNKLETNLKIK